MSVFIYFRYTLKFNTKQEFEAAMNFFKSLDLKKHFTEHEEEIVGKFLPRRSICIAGISIDGISIDKVELQITYSGDEYSHPNSDYYFGKMLELLVEKEKNINFIATTTLICDEENHKENTEYICKKGIIKKESSSGQIVCEEDYVKYIIHIVSYARFCRLFKIDKTMFDNNAYEKLILQMKYDYPTDIEYEDFLAICPQCKAKEEKYYSSTEELEDCGWIPFDEFDPDCEDEDENY